MHNRELTTSKINKLIRAGTLNRSSLEKILASFNKLPKRMRLAIFAMLSAEFLPLANASHDFYMKYQNSTNSSSIYELTFTAGYDTTPLFKDIVSICNATLINVVSDAKFVFIKDWLFYEDDETYFYREINNEIFSNFENCVISIMNIDHKNKNLGILIMMLISSLIMLCCYAWIKRDNDRVADNDVRVAPPRANIPPHYIIEMPRRNLYPAFLDTYPNPEGINARRIMHWSSSANVDIAIPESLLCPISQKIMDDPITVLTGVTYDRRCLWNKFANVAEPPAIKCLITGKNIKYRELFFDSCATIKKQLQSYLKKIEFRINNSEQVASPQTSTTPLLKYEVTPFNLSDEEEKKSVSLTPDSVTCSITKVVMTDPITLSSGKTFDRSSILRWSQGKANPFPCPLTNKPIQIGDVRNCGTNITILKWINAFHSHVIVIDSPLMTPQVTGLRP